MNGWQPAGKRDGDDDDAYFNDGPAKSLKAIGFARTSNMLQNQKQVQGTMQEDDEDPLDAYMREIESTIQP